MQSPTATARAMQAWPWPVALGNKKELSYRWRCRRSGGIVICYFKINFDLPKGAKTPQTSKEKS
jgi:hypothetical protein